VIEEAVTEFVASVHQSSPGLRTDYPIDWQAAVLLKLRDRSMSTFTEHSELIRNDRDVQGVETILEIAHRLATIALVVEPHELGLRPGGC